MNAPVLVDVRPRTVASRWRPLVLPLGIGLLLLGVTFRAEIAAAVRTWLDSTAYNHCFMIIPICLYLLWDRRSELAAVAARPEPALALLGVPLALLWLIAERLGIMEGRQLIAMSFAELLLLTVLGRRLWLAALGPLLYLYFLVPFGEFLTPKLQDVTTFFIRHGLDVLGVPAYIDGYIIEIPQGTFFVAEACAGLRFLVASIAFGCLYALLMYRSPLRRGVFIAVSAVVPIFANGLRGLGIVYLGYILGSAQAAAADHIIYGWLFFSFVILLLIVLGLPFRQDEMSLPPVPPAGAVAWPFPVRLAVLSVVAVAVLATLGPLVTSGAAMSREPALAAPVSIAVGSDCAIQSGEPPGSGAAAIHTQRVTCGGLALDMMWETFSPHVTAGPVMAERRRLSRRAATENLSESWLAATGPDQRAWRIMQSTDPSFVMATCIWIDGKAVRPGLAMRARMAITSLTGSDHAPMLVTVAPAVAWDHVTAVKLQKVAAELQAFLQQHPDLDARVGAASALQ